MSIQGRIYYAHRETKYVSIPYIEFSTLQQALRLITEILNMKYEVRLIKLDKEKL